MSVEQAFADSLREILLDEPFDKVSVTDICVRAHVSRTAFYDLYPDKMALLRKIIDSDLVQPVREVRRLLATREIVSAPQLLAEQVYQNVLSHREFYSRLNAADNYGLFPKVFVDLQSAMNAEVFIGVEMAEDERRYLSYFSAAANGILMSRWIESGYDIKPARLAHFLNNWVLSIWRRQ